MVPFEEAPERSFCTGRHARPSNAWGTFCGAGGRGQLPPGVAAASWQGPPTRPASVPCPACVLCADGAGEFLPCHSNGYQCHSCTNARRAAASHGTSTGPPRGPIYRLQEEAAEVQEGDMQARWHSCSVEGTGAVE